MTNKLKSRRRCLLRFLLVMVLLLIPTMLLAQHGKVSLNLQNEEVSQFIRQVEKQTNYTFVYRNNVLQPKTKVTCVCKDWPLEKALFQVFSSLGIQYSFNNNTIVLVKGKNENSERKGAKSSMGNTSSPTDKNKLSGVVRDVKGEPIIGASVFVKGTKIGTITNVDGEFSLDVPANSTLMVSYIGFATREISVKNHSNLKITLDEDAAHDLNEVVVVGYGTQK